MPSTWYGNDGYGVAPVTGWSIHWWLSTLALATGALTLLSMLKIWTLGFWRTEPAPSGADRRPTVRVESLRGAHVGIGVLVATALFVGLAAEPIYDIAFHAGQQLTDPTAYIEAVDPLRIAAAVESSATG